MFPNDQNVEIVLKGNINLIVIDFFPVYAVNVHYLTFFRKLLISVI